MKKINLTIPKPCHENWDQMTPEVKGRFCGSCQKTVIDFTNMSDRELAAFFKKPVDSVCGRFHQDQLNREITVPKKRIPWLRYFFHLAWPAFILMLKSCGPKDRVTRKAATTLAVNNVSTNENYEDIIVGALKVPDILPVDTVEVCSDIMGEAGVVEVIEPPKIMGDIELSPVDSVQGIDTTVFALSEYLVGKVIPRDTAIVTEFPISNCFEINIDSTISTTPVNTDSNQTIRLVDDVKESEVRSVIAYPNPSRAGSVLNLKFIEKETAPISIQLLTSGGQRVVHKVLGKENQATPVMLQLPTNLTSGIYFIQVMYANGSTNKVSVMVSQ